MKPLTLQDIFNNGVVGIRKQGGPATGASGSSNGCAYLSPDGRKCAIGHSIPVDKYNPAIDNGVGPVEALRICKIELDPNVNVTQLIEFQACHDNAAKGYDFMERFERYIAVFAKQFGLTIPAK